MFGSEREKVGFGIKREVVAEGSWYVHSVVFEQVEASLNLSQAWYSNSV
jgi:hypothetical protein